MAEIAIICQFSICFLKNSKSFCAYRLDLVAGQIFELSIGIGPELRFKVLSSGHNRQIGEFEFGPKERMHYSCNCKKAECLTMSKLAEMYSFTAIHPRVHRGVDGLTFGMFDWDARSKRRRIRC